MTGLLSLVLVGSGAAAILLASALLFRWTRERVVGSLVSVDAGPDSSWTLRSDRYRIVGRPDLVRRGPEGRAIPIEIKSRPSYRDGPPRSHILQLWAYCLLLEENESARPTHGILRYGDGVEYRVPWGTEERRILLELRDEMATPYDGRARPAPARCARCRWWSICDARA